MVRARTLSSWLVAFGFVTIGLSSSSLLSAEDLKPREGLPEIAYRAEAAGDGKLYSHMAVGDRASHRFCGQGELQILSRALLADDADAARYALDLRVDGTRPVRELAYRSTEATGRFEGATRGTNLRRTRVDLDRGCHLITLALARSTAPAVGVRLVWKEEAPTLRRWQPAHVGGGRSVELAVGDERTPYRLVEAAEELELVVGEASWVRLLVRPVGREESADFAVDVTRDGDPHRAVELETRRSRRARLAGQPDLAVGGASEVVFPADPGRTWVVRTGVRALVRAQLAPRSVDRDAAGRWATRARLSTYYDSNILRYSDKFIQRFEAGRDPDRFRVDSLDDTIVRADLDVDHRFTGFGGLPAQLAFGVEHRAYTRNSIKDWSRFRASWEQNLRRGRTVSLHLDRTTDFYVRHLRDGDLVGSGSTADPFQAFSFRKLEARARFTRQVGASSHLRLDLIWKRFDHATTFREFDSDDLAGLVRIDHRVGRRWRLSSAVELTDSSARGYDEAGETLATSDDTDPSYRQVDVMAAVRYRFPGARRPTLFLQAEVGRRDYTTDKTPSLAPLHSGREDDFLRFYGSWQIDLSPRYQLTVFAQSRDRSSSAPVNLDIGVEKDYEQWEAGVRITARYGG
ncbi:MAG: hypothetical protein AAGE94_13185 [Acidobacteriota bacterium]